MTKQLLVITDEGEVKATLLQQVTCRWMESSRTRRAMKRIQYALSATSLAILCQVIAGTKTASSSTPLPLDSVHRLMVLGSTSKRHLGAPGKQVIHKQLVPNLFSAIDSVAFATIKVNVVAGGAAIDHFSLNVE